MLRFAPSPTGDLHIGSLRVAIFNYIISKQKNEEFIVRIEDTDKERNIEDKDKEILDLLGLFGIRYSQVIYQSENVRFHTAMALQLMHEKKAFSCFCSPNWLENKREEAKAAKKYYMYDDACRNLPHELVIDNTSPFTIRIKKPDVVNSKASNLDSFVIMDQDKKPTYDFACAIDDMLSDISMIIRSEEHINNTSKQELIRDSLGYDKKIEYAYLPVILNDMDKEITEKDKTSNVKWLLKEGFLPEAIINYVLLIGNETPKEIFSMSEAIEWFDLSKISKSPAHFDIAMLKHINHEHLINLEDKELSRYVGFADEEIGKLAKVYLEEVSTTKELKAKIAAIFATKKIPSKFKEVAKTISSTIKTAPYFEEYDDFKSYVMKESGLNDTDFSSAFRFLLTGADNGPEIAKIYKYLKNYIGEIIK